MATFHIPGKAWEEESTLTDPTRDTIIRELIGEPRAGDVVIAFVIRGETLTGEMFHVDHVCATRSVGDTKIPGNIIIDVLGIQRRLFMGETTETGEEDDA